MTKIEALHILASLCQKETLPEPAKTAYCTNYSEQLKEKKIPKDPYIQDIFQIHSSKQYNL